MTFDDILAQIIDLLQRQGRVSYGALKRRYHLDDAYLEDLKDEIIHAQRLATDEEGRILVWNSHAEGAAATVSPPDQTTQQPLAQHHQPVQGVPPPSAARTPEAQRRQLTVMLCDLVNSTTLFLATRSRRVPGRRQCLSDGCVPTLSRRYDGHIAQLLGDGLLVYFGYPQAHEDDAQRSVRTGLGILDAVGDLQSGAATSPRYPTRSPYGHPYWAGCDWWEDGQYGETRATCPGRNAGTGGVRMQGLAAPNTLVMSDTTHRLVQGYFDCQDLGEQTLRGVAEPLTVYQVLRESGATSRLDVAQPRGLTPLVGREFEAHSPP